jgi:hypothetical protein
MRRTNLALAVFAGLALQLPSAQALTVRSAVGATAGDIQATVDQFRTDLGVNNGLGPCAGACVPGVGRREINWDAVPDSFSSGGTNPFPGNFFNLASGNPAGRVRGAQFTTAGGFEVSADSDSDNDGNPGPVATLFGNHSPDNADDFAAFSPERIFGLNGTNQMDVTFSIPGSPGSSATVRGFGVVFTDVEQAGAAVLQFFDRNDQLLHTEAAPPFVFPGGDSGKSFSFVGVSFDDPVIARVHILNGGFDLGLNVIDPTFNDAVAMDDFIYGEPVPVPPALLLLGSGLIGLAARRRAR